MTLHDACTIGRIYDESSVLGSSKATTGDFRNQMKAEFRYAVKQSPLLRPYWFAQAIDCFVRVPDLTVPKSADTTTPSGPPPKAAPPKGNGGGGGGGGGGNVIFLR